MATSSNVEHLQMSITSEIDLSDADEPNTDPNDFCIASGSPSPPVPLPNDVMIPLTDTASNASNGSNKSTSPFEQIKNV